MKKKIFAVILILMLVSICQSEAATTYQLEIGGINYSGVADLDRIAGFEGSISGTAGTDWILGTIFGSYDIEWGFDEGPGTYFGGSDFSSSESFPLNDGIILTIISPNDTPLTLTSFDPYDYDVDAYGGSVNASLNAVPIPGALWLLGSGLIGMVGVRRKVGKS